jgi:single-strand DNA-binding protein
VAASNINRVILTGNLTSDPELRVLASDLSVCKMRVAVNGRKKNNTTGEWEDKPNFFDVTVWGPQGENCAQYLVKGRPVAIDGRLEFSEWVDKETGKNRSKVEVVADNVQFLHPRPEGGYGDSGSDGEGFAPRADVPVDQQ